MTTLSFTQAVRFLKCPPQYLSDQIEAGRVEFTFNQNGKYLLSLKSVRKLVRDFSIPETTKREPPKKLTSRVKAYRLYEMVEEAKNMGLSLNEYRETVIQD